jgi:DNA-binding NtrC family response regulator
MSPTPIIVVNDNPTFQEQLEQRLVASAYEATILPSSAPLSLTDEHQRPGAVVINVPCNQRLAQEQCLQALLDDDPQVPVLVCSDRPTVLQSAVKALSSRPGTVLACSPDADELLAKLKCI